MGGAFWTLLGIIRFAGSLNEKNSPVLQSAIWQIASGVSVIFAAILFRTLNFDFEFVIKLLSFASKMVVFAGSMWILYGVIILADSLRNTNAPALESSIWQIIGGIFVCIAAFMLNNIISIIK